MSMSPHNEVIKQDAAGVVMSAKKLQPNCGVVRPRKYHSDAHENITILD